jgi:hypothetical protein
MQVLFNNKIEAIQTSQSPALGQASSFEQYFVPIAIGIAVSRGPHQAGSTFK